MTNVNYGPSQPVHYGPVNGVDYGPQQPVYYGQPHHAVPHMVQPQFPQQQYTAQQQLRPAPRMQSATTAPGYSYSMKRQSVKVHLLLLVLTGGIGNVFYAMACRSKAAARYKW